MGPLLPGRLGKGINATRFFEEGAHNNILDCYRQEDLPGSQGGHGGSIYTLFMLGGASSWNLRHSSPVTARAFSGNKPAVGLLAIRRSFLSLQFLNEAKKKQKASRTILTFF